ncbi:MAG: GFA family protein [Rhizobiaceae bacterium]
MTQKPMFVHCCHCSECQNLTGSAFVLNAIIETDLVEVDGATSQITLPTPSGHGQTITRCAQCGVTVYSAYLSRKGKLLYVRVGTLDDPAQCPPDVHIFTSSKLPWVTLSDEVPVHENFYPMPDAWPDESRTRWSRVFGDG